jgi:hypothetical protein
MIAWFHHQPQPRGYLQQRTSIWASFLLQEESDADFMEDLDVTGKAEVLALAKRMLRRKTRDELLEGAYNKYAFHDTGALPRWFAEDQQRYARRAVSRVS